MNKGHSKSGVKYAPLVTSSVCQGEILLPGRHVCNCEATKHALVNNCLSCGRIVCEQERSGPCFTCGHLVCSPKEQEQISRMSKTGCKLYQKLMSQGKEFQEKNEDLKDSGFQNVAPGLQNALKHRDKLLEYDQTIERRTKVIDDQNDYFQTDSNWLSNKERTLMKKKKDEVYDIMHGRKKTTVTFDFDGKTVIEDKPVINYDVEELLKPDTSIFECRTPDDVNIPMDFIPSYKDKEDLSKKTYVPQREDPIHFEDKLKVIRIQDKELQEMSDEGKCLSLHQPYASLLVQGIKKHEGRVWYTSYRGRLWIHAAAKVASNNEITEIQSFYKKAGVTCKFPETYPSGCLLGCVDLVDCLPQEEYKSQYPSGEIASPYVFLCENPQELNLKFPMQGKKNIYKLESNIHQAAKKTLRKTN